MATSKYITPGFYSTETDLTFSNSSSIGVTTLGVVGETQIGPAFQPIFVDSYDMFKTYFGGLNPEKFPATSRAKYELPYIAKEYLKQSNQLYVTRTLGLSGFKAGPSWGIAIEANVDPSTVTLTASGTSFTVAFSGNSVTVSGATVLDFYQSGFLSEFDSLYTYPLNSEIGIDTVYKKNGSNFTGLNLNLTINSNVNGVGTALGTYDSYSGTPYEKYDGNIVALIRSSGKYDGSENLTFSVADAENGLVMIPSSDLAYNPYGTFTLSGTSHYTGSFSYNVSLDSSNRNYIEKTLGLTNKANKTALFLEELYTNTLSTLIAGGYVYGITPQLVKFGYNFENYKTSYTTPESPFVVSEVRGSNIFKLFKFISVADGDSANTQIKISITDINPDTKLFNVIVRKFNDTDANPVVLESFTQCSMDSTNNLTYVAAKIGTSNNNYPSKSNYIMLEMSDEILDDSFPSGFLGYPVRNYGLGGVNYENLNLFYNKAYAVDSKKKKEYLGISNITGYDTEFFSFKGIPKTGSINWTGTTDGFHMDSGVTIATLDGDQQILSGNTIYYPVHSFQTGNAEFRTIDDMTGTDYETSVARKFTLALYGGFDGWDIHRESRTNTDTYMYNGTKAKLGITNGNFINTSLSDGSDALTSDYYAYLTAIKTFDNKWSTPINVIATPGIDAFDHSNLVQETIDMVEDQGRQDISYVYAIPDTDYNGNVYSESDVVNTLGDQFDSSFATTYWPWNQYNDTENNQYIWLPPTYDFCRDVAEVGNKSYLWFAIAGIARGTVNAIQTRKKLKKDESDILYANRINPIIYFPSDGIKIWGNKTSQIKDSALNRLNIRMLLNQTKSLIDAATKKLTFDPNDDQVRTEFMNIVTPILNNIKKQRGFYDYKVKIEDSAEIRDRLELPAKFLIKPTRTLEYLSVNFTITSTGINFDDL